MSIKLKQINTYVFFILCYMCVIPLIASITYDKNTSLNLENVNSVLSLNHFPYADNWYQLFYIIILCGLFCIIYILKNISPTILKENKLILFFELLFILSIISFIFSSNHYRSFFGSGYRHDGLITYILFICIFCMSTLLSKKQIKMIIEVFTFVSMILGLLCIFQNNSFVIKHFYSFGYSYGYSLFLQRTHYGSLLSMSIPACFFLYLNDDYTTLNKVEKTILLLLRNIEFWILVNTMFFNATRAMVLSSIFTIICGNIYVFSLNSDKWKEVVWLDTIIIATFVFLNTGNHLIDRFEEGREKMKNGTDFTSSVDYYSNSRITMWTSGIKYALQKPFFGYGPDNLFEAFYNDGLSYTDRPHNEIIQIAASLGIPAMICYCLAIFEWLKILIKKLKKLESFTVSVFLIGISYLVCSLFSNSMFYTTSYFYMFLGFSYTLSKDC